MKKNLCFLILSLFIGYNTYASHFMGGELHYEYTGSAYKVDLALYTDCSQTLQRDTQYVNLRSTSCNVSTTLFLTRYASDTLFDLYCPGVSTGCNQPSLYPYFIVNRYSATAAITPCSDWKLSFSDGSRNQFIQNQTGTNGYNIYLEAFLNNSIAPNSSPVFGTDAPLTFGVNSDATLPFQVLDIEGDSITGAFYQPLSSAGVPVPYSTGYSLVNPIGGYATLDVPKGLLHARSTNSGKFTLATRVYDYRNGVLVGYSSRDWLTSIYGTDSKAPLPAPGSSFVTTACPGGPSSITFHFTDSLVTDSVYLDVLPQNTFGYTTVHSNGIGSATATTTWTTPVSLNPAVTPYYFLKVQARDNSCPRHELARYTVLVRTASCLADSVWPGDANADKIVNLYDALYVALAYNRTGPVRTGATTSWTPQVCAPWSLLFNNGINIKHADCDGSGLVDNTDLAAITANYGMTHLRGSDDGNQHRGTGLPELYFDHTGIVAAPGNIVTIPVKLGTASQPMGNILGLAAKINVSGTASPVAISYPASWIGNAAGTVRFGRNNGMNNLDWTYARNDRTNVSGQGQIAALTFTIPAGAGGQKIILKMTDVRIIDAAGQELTAFNVFSDTLNVIPASVSNIGPAAFQAMIVPNPSGSNASLLFTLQHAAAVQVTITDLAGRIAWNSSDAYDRGNREMALPASLRSGMYLIRISDGSDAAVVKWIKAE